MQSSLPVGRVLFVFVCLQQLHCGLSRSTNNTFVDLIDDVINAEDYELGGNAARGPFLMEDLEKRVHFWLFTRERSDVGHELVPSDPDTLTSSGFDEDRPTKILIHGWLGDSESMMSVCSTIKVEYFMLGDYNVVCVDWSWLAFDVTYYFTARYRCEEIGNYVAKLISMLTDNTSQELNDMHVIGFSMGAHIAGFAGKRLDGQVQRITGLDPARPLFSSKRPEQRLSENDAKFVDVIHTTNWVLGQHKPIGNIDFYPNDGNRKQPGCDISFLEYIYGEVCSHLKAYQFYARSIRFKDQFKAVKCDQWKDFEQSLCADYDNFTYLGEDANPDFSGNYYLSVV